MGKIIELKVAKDTKHKAEEIFERHNAVMDESFREELEDLKEDFIRFDGDRLRNLLLVEKLLEKSMDGNIKIRRGMGNVLPNMCTIYITTKKFSVRDIVAFKDAMSLATCFEIYSEIDGKLHLNFSFYGMNANIDWEKGLRMLLEGMED